MLFRKTNTEHPAGMRKETSLSVIAQGLHILGNIASDGLIDLAGSIEGNIRAHSLTVRASGEVKGDITAEIAHIYGKVSGLIRAREVHLYAGCHVEGTIMHETLTMEDGAFLDGKCKRTDKLHEEEPEAKPMPFNWQDDDKPIAEMRPFENLRLIR